ncbi:MAG TPA: GvpL/GvpF family gas vesicle protein [Candidatus Limnocylindria bacterium]|nr:GvpL/GvpF family gas vesicle protein [Candidatus Limnocylindria bacterium]
MSVLLHAIADRALADPPRGLRGAALEFVAAGPLGVWASPVEGDAATRDDAFDHHRVVEALCARQPCLPVRFGTRAADAEGARSLVSARAEELARALERVGRRRELAVTLLWLDAAARPGRGHAVEGGPPGRAFLERKRAAYEADERQRSRAEALARALEAGLSADQADVRHAFCPSPLVALSTAILAPAGEADAMKERVVRVASGLGGVRAVVSGPWPPYTFAGAT